MTGEPMANTDRERLAWQGVSQALTAAFKAGYETKENEMTGPEGPAALEWDDKVQRIVAVLDDRYGVQHGIPDKARQYAEVTAERILNAIGDANV